MADAILCARLFGHLASWGTQAAGNSVRPTSRHPPRGALIGIVAAAHGISRADEATLAQLGRSLLVAAASHGRRRVIEDFRTVQTVAVSAKAVHRTRADALAHGVVHTSTSERQHVEDGLWRVFLACTEESPFSLDAIAAALERPSYELYLGRREFPLALPPSPQIEPGGLQRALAAYPAVPLPEGAFGVGELRSALKAMARLFKPDEEFDLTWDGGFPGAPDDGFRSSVFDDPASRAAWRFHARPEWRKRMAPLPAVARPSLHDEFFGEEF